jgi:endonuclease III
MSPTARGAGGAPGAAAAARRPAPKPAAAKTAAKKPASRRRAKPGPGAVARAWARRLEKTRPGLIEFVLETLAAANGRPAWERRLDPASELVLTILSQNSADTNAEAAFESLRAAYPSAPRPSDATDDPRHFRGWGGKGLRDLPPPDWAAVEAAPLPELINVIRPGGLAPQKAPRIQAALAALVANGGGYSLEFLASKPPLDARDWLAAIPGIGKKTASVVLLFSFGLPLMPVDRHVHRVSQRVGLIPPRADADAAHDLYLAMLAPVRMYETHVSLIEHGRRTCHAQRPECEQCPIAPRCRFFDSKAE